MRKYILTHTIVVVVLIFLLISGCAQQGGSEADNALVKDAVTRYVTLLAKGYQSLNMTSLRQVSTEKRATKAYYYMAAFGEGKARMISHITSLQFGRIDISGNKAKVSAVEKWDYEYRNIDSGKQMLKNSVSYKLRYHLLRDKGRWLVDDIDILETKQGNRQALSFIRRQGTEAIYQ